MDEVTGESVSEAPKIPKMVGKDSKRVNSLGWITESTVMPRKRREINGVGAGSILDLRAELYRTQEDAKKSKDSVDPDVERSRKKFPKLDVFSKKNSGVDDRASRDKLHLKVVNDGSASYAALEKKAELYDKLVKGEVSVEDDEQYNVLFYKKGTLEDEFQEIERERTGESLIPNTSIQGNSLGGPTFEKQPLVTFTSTGLSQEQKNIIKEVNEETKQERDKAFNLRQRREEIAARKREQLRKAYLKKKLEAVRKSQIQPTEDVTPSTNASKSLESGAA